jgi:tryptophanyl-tRNA synthetase
MTTAAPGRKPRVMSGMRPTGNLHLGHLVGVLTQWVNFCDTADAYFEIADLHAFTTEFEDPSKIRDARNEMVAVWLAAGVDPQRATIFLQSGVPEIGELQVLLSMITPVSWLERVPTYKDQINALGPEIATHGFLGYPVLQTVDIAIFKGEGVPVGQDQLPHLELCREIVRRFNHLYGPVLVEPEAILSQTPYVPGTDGRKMSKSYDNALLLADTDSGTIAKVKDMFTDPEKIKKTDPGHPETCPVFFFQQIVNSPNAESIAHRCRAGQLGCVANKADMAEHLNRWLAPIRERRRKLEERPGDVDEIIAEGTKRARIIARETLAEVKAAMGMA